MQARDEARTATAGGQDIKFGPQIAAGLAHWVACQILRAPSLAKSCIVHSEFMGALHNFRERKMPLLCTLDRADTMIPCCQTHPEAF